MCVCMYTRKIIRRKFRSQPSDNMDRWKSRGGKSQRRKEKKREDHRREGVRRKKTQGRQKVVKSRFTMFFQRIVALEGRKIGSLKRRARSHVVKWEMKNWMPLWREAHFKVKSVKNWRSRTTFRSWDVESARRCQNVQNTPCSHHFWKLRCWKSAFRCGAKHIPKSKCTKHTMLGALLKVVMLKKCTLLWRAARQRKCTPLWRKAHFHVKMLKTRHARITLESSNVVPRGGRKGFCILPNVSKMWGFCSISKNDGKRGTFEEDLEWSGNMHFTWQAQYKRHVYLLGGHYADFLRRGCILEIQVC